MSNVTIALTNATNDFADLEAALTKAVKDIEAKANARAITSEVRAARHRLTQANTTQEERAELLAKIDQWEQANIWTTAGISAMVQRQVCSCCGEVTLSPIGYYRYQVGRKDASLQRWVRIAKLDLSEQLSASYPRSVIFQDSCSDFCMSCLDLIKFDLAAGQVKCLQAAYVEKLHEEVL